MSQKQIVAHCDICEEKTKIPESQADSKVICPECMAILEGFLDDEGLELERRFDKLSQ